jgi:hypothetical protein
MKLGQAIFMGLITLAIFWDLSAGDQVTMMGLVGCLFHLLIN